MNHSYRSIQLDASGNEIDPAAVAQPSQPVDDFHIDVIDVNQMNERMRTASREIVGADAETVERQRDVNRDVQRSETFAQRAADVAAASTRAHESGDHARAQALAKEAYRLSRLSTLSASVVVDKANHNAARDAMRADAGPSATDKLRGELAALEAKLGYRL